MIEILVSGLQTTIQDLGRFGQMHLGISQSGVMDDISCKMANRLVGVADNNPVIECTQSGPTIKFHTPMKIAITGADMQFLLNDIPVPSYQSILVNTNDVLSFQRINSGFRSYIAFDKAMDIPEILGSASTHVTAKIGGLNGRPLRSGDIIRFHSATIKRSPIAQMPMHYSGNYQLRYTDTPESNLFTAMQQTQFQRIRYRVSPDLNRMGIRLGTDTLLDVHALKGLQSRGLTPGAIQIPPNGTPIIAAKDAQTTGGYHRIGQIISADLPIIGQLKPGDDIQFLHMTVDEARTVRAQQDLLLETTGA